MRIPAVVFLILLLTSATSRAGMPSPLPFPPPETEPRLADITVERLQVISFFLFALLVSAGAVWGLWAILRRDVPQLPRLSFGGALAGTLLWGLLAVIVLTMISGARELMTPGAWKRNGPTYVLADPSAANPEGERMRQMMALRAALRSFADRHSARFPNQDEKSQILDDLWIVPGSGGKRYEYVPGGSARDDFGKLLAYEPDLGPGPRLELYTDGIISAGRSKPSKQEGGVP